MKFATIAAPALGGLALLASAFTQAQSLAETIDLALDFQSRARLSQLNVQQQQAQLTEAERQTGWRASVQGELGVGRVETSRGALFPEQGNRFLQQAGFQVTYPIYTAGRERFGIEAAQAGIAAAQAQAETTRQQIRLQALNVLSALIRDQALLSLERDTQKSLDRAVFDAAKRLKAGEVTKTDLAQAQARQALGLASQSRARANLAVSESQYRALTGVSPVQVPTQLPRPAIPATPDAAMAQLEHSPELDAARAALTAAERRYSGTQRELMPSVLFNGRGITQKDSDFSRNRLTTYGVSLQATWPLLDGGIADSHQQQARLAVEQAREQLRAVREGQQQRLREDYARLRASQAQAPALREAEKAAVLALDTIRREMELGTRTTFDLLTAQRDLLETRTQIVLNQQEQTLLHYQILADLGGLDRVGG